MTKIATRFELMKVRREHGGGSREGQWPGTTARPDCAAIMHAFSGNRAVRVQPGVVARRKPGWFLACRRGAAHLQPTSGTDLKIRNCASALIRVYANCLR